MKRLLAILALAFSIVINAEAQNNVGINNASPDPSAALMVDTTAAGPSGVMVPRMRQARRNAISNPATGLMVYQTDGTAGFYYYDGTAWTAMSGGGTTLPSQTGNAGKVLTTNGTNLSWGTVNSYELYVVKTTAEAQSTTVSSSLSLPDAITFSNTSADPVNAPLNGSSAPYNTANGKWEGANGKFTATNAGLYFVDVQICDTYPVAPYLMLDLNGSGNSGASYYGTGAVSASTLQNPHRGRGSLQRLVWMNANDYFIVRATGSSTSVGLAPSVDGSTYIKIVRLK